jgi:hypothetical protein
MERKRELLRQEDFDDAIDAGIVVTHLSGMATRCSNDLTMRREIDAVAQTDGEGRPRDGRSAGRAAAQRVRPTKPSDLKSASLAERDARSHLPSKGHTCCLRTPRVATCDVNLRAICLKCDGGSASLPVAS